MPRPTKEKEILTDEEKEEKRLEAIATGVPIDSVSCPLCGFNRPLSGRKRGTRFDQIDLDDALIFQKKYAGGYKSGFYTNEIESFTLEEMKRMPEFEDILDQIREQCHKILKILE